MRKIILLYLSVQIIFGNLLDLIQLKDYSTVVIMNFYQKYLLSILVS